MILLLLLKNNKIILFYFFSIFIPIIDVIIAKTQAIAHIKKVILVDLNIRFAYI